MPATQNCRDIFDRGSHLLVGVSPFNSRFSDEYVARLIGWVKEHCARFDVLLAGDEAALLLEALGTPSGQARRKARRAVARNRRSVEAAFAAHGLGRLNGRVHTFSDFQETAAYRRTESIVRKAFLEHREFRWSCLEMAEQAVHGRLRAVYSSTARASVESIELAAGYVLAELPFFLNTAEILGLPESLLVYHRPWRLGEQIFAGRLPVSVSEKQGYLTVREGADAPCVAIAGA
jgi:cyclo(L-leucyl-L-leucyl) synthase